MGQGLNSTRIRWFRDGALDQFRNEFDTQREVAPYRKGVRELSSYAGVRHVRELCMSVIISQVLNKETSTGDCYISKTRSDIQAMQFRVASET